MSARRTGSQIDHALVRQMRESVTKVLCQSAGHKCERQPRHRAAAAHVDKFWTGVDGRNIAALTAWVVPKEFCRESLNEDAPICCYDCCCREHLIFSESIRNHSLQSEGPLGKDKALEVVKRAILKTFTAQRERFLWTRLVALFKSPDAQIRIFALEVLNTILRTDPASDILIAKYVSIELTAVLSSYPALLVQHAVNLLVALTDRKDAVVCLIGQRVVHDAFEQASQRNEAAIRFLTAMRRAVCRVDVHDLIDYHLHCSPSLRTVDSRFETMACTALVFLADSRELLLRNSYPALFDTILPEMLESKDANSRVLAARVLEHILRIIDVRLETVMEIAHFPWRSVSFRHLLEDPKLVDLCATTVRNVCLFIVRAHRPALIAVFAKVTEQLLRKDHAAFFASSNALCSEKEVARSFETACTHLKAGSDTGVPVDVLINMLSVSQDSKDQELRSTVRVFVSAMISTEAAMGILSNSFTRTDTDIADVCSSFLLSRIITLATSNQIEPYVARVLVDRVHAHLNKFR